MELVKENHKMNFDQNINNENQELIVKKMLKYEQNLFNKTEYVLKFYFENQDLNEINKLNYEQNLLKIMLLIFYLELKIQTSEFHKEN